MLPFKTGAMMNGIWFVHAAESLPFGLVPTEATIGGYRHDHSVRALRRVYSAEATFGRVRRCFHRYKTSSLPTFRYQTRIEVSLDLNETNAISPPRPFLAIVFGTRFGGVIIFDRHQFDERKIARAGDEVQRCAKLHLLSAHAVARADIHSICA